MSDKKIPEGTRVNVYWNRHSGLFDVELVYRPVATGDTFVFRKKDGTLVEASYFERMEVAE